MSPSAEPDGHDGPPCHVRLTLPNLLTLTRLLGSFVLPAVALSDREQAFLWLYIVLTMTDWLDGKLAILLDQRSSFGARLDSWADIALYAALLFGLVWLRGEALIDEAGWIASALLAYAIAVGYAFHRFGRWPSYHTRAAKTCWLLVFGAVIALLGPGLTWPIEIAMAGVVVTNIESILITYHIDRWRTDVRSVFEVITRKRG